MRLLGIQTSHVSRAGDGRQMTLFDDADYEKREKLDRAMDRIRERFGTDSVKRASFLLQDQIDHAVGRGKHFD